MTRPTDHTLLAMSAADPVDADALRAGLDPVEIAAAMRRAIDLGENPRSPIPAGDAVARSFRSPSRRPTPGRPEAEASR